MVDQWLSCVECDRHQLDTVRALATRHPATVDTLRADLLYGPSPARRDSLKQQFAATWQRLADYVARDTVHRSLPFPKPDYIRYYLGKTLEIYQGRAAIALGAIGTSAAQGALDRALLLPPGTFPASVVAQIHYARDTLAP